MVHVFFSEFFSLCVYSEHKVCISLLHTQPKFVTAEAFTWHQTIIVYCSHTPHIPKLYNKTIQVYIHDSAFFKGNVQQFSLVNRTLVLTFKGHCNTEFVSIYNILVDLLTLT